LAQTRAGSKSFLSVFSVRFSPVTTVGLTDMSKHQDKSVAANSWASISGGKVRQAGARDLWDEAVTAYQWWTRHDRPDRQQFQSVGQQVAARSLGVIRFSRPNGS
jgi:hypothetical protein